ncbi:MAG: lipopolysaccharide core heptose(I) kinase RfaP, partial [Cellvibrionaceae bacterium]
MTVILRDVFADTWDSTSAFDEVRKLQGTTIREKEGRRTLRFDFADKRFYLKHHRGVGWPEILKNWSQFKAPVTGAANEWQAINKLTEIGIHTLTPVAYGVRGKNPAKRESFLITQELIGTVSLAKYTENWPSRPPPFPEKKQLIEAVAHIARHLHQQGINHRDLYICHLLLNQASSKTSSPVLHLVDLHRAQCRAKVPYRWLVKDVGSLYFSSADIGLTQRDVFRFLRIYFDKPLRRILNEDRRFLLAARSRAVHLYRG